MKTTDPNAAPPPKLLTVGELTALLADLPDDAYVGQADALGDLFAPFDTDSKTVRIKLFREAKVAATRRTVPGTPTEIDRKFGTTPPDVQITYPAVLLR